MRGRNLDRRFTEIMIGLLLLIAGVSALGGAEVFLIVLGIIGFMLLARQFGFSSTAASRRAPLNPEEALPAQPRVDQVYAHALDAVRSASLDPADTPVLPIDIGVMAFSGADEPVIYRTRQVPDNVDYLQPFVQLRLPTRAKGRVRFELLDSEGQVRFVHEQDYDFERGRNLITPAARLPIHDARALDGEWRLQIRADGVLIADHHFEWEESTSKVIRRHLKEDGELSGEVRAMMAESRLQRMSLDELLSEQEAAPQTAPEAPRPQESRRS
ncbi:MAG: hypothetical protein ABI835_05215 [Chloroflexota bacterium]